MSITICKHYSLGNQSLGTEPEKALKVEDIRGLVDDYSCFVNSFSCLVDNSWSLVNDFLRLVSHLSRFVNDSSDLVNCFSRLLNHLSRVVNRYSDLVYIFEPGKRTVLKLKIRKTHLLQQRTYFPENIKLEYPKG